MAKKSIHIFLTAVFLLLLCPRMAADELPYAGLTPAQATEIADTMMLKVQDGGNYIKLTEQFLPATLSYLPDSAFGPIPVVIPDAKDTLPASVVFEDCIQQWRWKIPAAEESSIVTISAHENARILVEPRICPPDWDTTAVEFDRFEWRGEEYTESQDVVIPYILDNGCEYTHTLHLTIHHTIENTEPQHACDEFQWQGKTYTESGLYTIDTVELANGDRQINKIDLTLGHSSSGEQTLSMCVSYTAPWGTTYTESDDIQGAITNTAGCDSVITIHLTVIPDCTTYDTLYFCPGQLKEEYDYRVNDNYVKRYRFYAYESPKNWDYMEGVILGSEHTRTRMDLHRAEQNLLAHYVGGLMPIDNISWSVRYDGAQVYEPLAAGDGPQWINSGMLALQVQFLCGIVYNEQYPTDVENIDIQQHPTKRIENGQVIILRGGEKYNLLGTKIR